MGVEHLLVGQVTKILRTKYLCHYPRRFHIKFQPDRPSSFRRSLKVRLDFDISMTLGQGQEMALTLINYTFTNDSISCLHLATFKYHAAIAAKISIVYAFSHVTAYVSKIDLVVK